MLQESSGWCSPSGCRFSGPMALIARFYWFSRFPCAFSLKMKRRKGLMIAAEWMKLWVKWRAKNPGSKSLLVIMLSGDAQSCCRLFDGPPPNRAALEDQTKTAQMATILQSGGQRLYRKYECQINNLPHHPHFFLLLLNWICLAIEPNRLGL